MIERFAQIFAGIALTALVAGCGSAPAETPAGA